MFYNFIQIIVISLIHILNGKPKVLNKNNLPKGNYILVAPHRTWLDPLFLAMSAYPKKFTFMAKKELFKNYILRFILNHTHAFSVDRKKPGPSAIKTPVKLLKNSNMSLIMFPSGTRHSQSLKSGMLLISKLSKVPIIPAVYQGPLTFKDLIKRKKTTINIGKPIYINSNLKLNMNTQKKLINQIEETFKKLDQEINPDYIYIDPTTKNNN